ncbi:MAG: hypothetical protein Kow0069_19180 [Promethearchaeota archaeon]
MNNERKEPDQSMEGVISKTAVFAVTKVASFLGLFLADLLLRNNLATSGYADYYIFKTYSIFFRILVLFGIDSALITFWRSKSNLPDRTLFKYSAALMSIFFGAVVLVVIWFVFGGVVHLRDASLTNLALFGLMLATVFTDAFYRFLEATLFAYHAHGKISLLNLLNGGFFVAAVAGVKVLGYSGSIAIACYATTFAVTFLGGVFTLVREYGKHARMEPEAVLGVEGNPRDQFPEFAKVYLKFCLPLIGSTVFYYLYFYVNEIFLNELAGGADLLAYYSFSKNFIVEIVSFVGLTFATALFPFIADVIKANNGPQLHQIAQLTKFIYVVIILPLLLVTLVLPSQIFSLLRLPYQSDHLLFVTFKQIVFGGFFYSLVQLLQRYFVAANHTRFIFLTQALSGLVNLVLVATLLQDYGIFAAIWGFNFSLLVLGAAYLYKFHALFHETRVTRQLLKVVAIYIVVNLVDYALEAAFSSEFTVLFVTLVAYTVLLFGLKVVSIQEFRDFVQFATHRLVAGLRGVAQGGEDRDE